MTTDYNLNDISLIRTYGPDPVGTPKELRKFKSPIDYYWSKITDIARIPFTDAYNALQEDPTLFFGVSPMDLGLIALDVDRGTVKVNKAIEAELLPKPLFSLKTMSDGLHLYYRFSDPDKGE